MSNNKYSEQGWLEKITEILKTNPQGLMLKEIAELLSVNKYTVSKYCLTLEMLKKIKCRKLGVAKLYTIIEVE